jgi:DNA mismatch repair protein MutS2
MPIAQNIAFPEHVSWLIISGPNAGGKSVSLNSIGLTVWMHSCGLPIPCSKDSRVPDFGSIAMVAGDAQDIDADLSTFSGHLARLKQTLKTLRQGDLLLIDEPMDGTDPDQGAALAQSLLEFANENGIVGAVSTHYPRLKHLGGSQPDFGNARVEYEAQRNPPLYGFEVGSAASSEPFKLARNVDFPAKIIDRAMDIMGPDIQIAESLKDTLSARIDATEELRKELELEREKSSIATRELENARKRLVERGDDHIDRSVKRTLSQLDKALSSVRDIVRDLQSNPNSEKARRATERIKEIQSDINPITSAKRDEEPIRTPDAPSDWLPQIGDNVLVCSLGKEARVRHIKGSTVEVQAGAIRVTRPLADLRPTKEAPAPVKAMTHRVERREEISSISLDLRGMRRDEALSKLDQFVDRGLLENRNELHIIHGHGTAALKRAVREYARTHPSVAKFEAETGEGINDGATVISLK